MTTIIALPLIISPAFGAMALLGARPWPMIVALPLVLGGARCIA